MASMDYETSNNPGKNARQWEENCPGKLALPVFRIFTSMHFPNLEEVYVMHEVTSVPPETRKLVCVVILVHQRQVSQKTVCIILLKGGWRPLLSSLLRNVFRCI